MCYFLIANFGAHHFVYLWKRSFFCLERLHFTLFLFDEATKQKAFWFPFFLLGIVWKFWRPFLFYLHHTHKTVPILHTYFMTLPTLLIVEQVNLAENGKQECTFINSVTSFYVCWELLVASVPGSAAWQGRFINSAAHSTPSLLMTWRRA